MMNKNIVCILVLLLFSVKTYALSSYENRRLIENMQRIGLIAFVKPDSVNQITSIARKINADKFTAADGDILNLSLYVKKLHKQTVLFAYFESPDKSIFGWEKRFAGSSSLISSLNKGLQGHVRAPHGAKWLRMEWMNLIASDEAFPYNIKNNSQIQKMGLVSGLKPEKELTYRQLHQSNWPGVVDGMVKSNYRNWTTFLIEMDSKIYLFTYTEYIGKDIQEDNRLMGLDPTTQRWWQHTEPCLINLHGEGNWSLMTPLMEQNK